KIPVLDQGSEGSCTGFGLATVANFLLRCRKVRPSNDNVSPRMLYELAKRYDEWPGENYSGSSARGAMKGWNKHGVCLEEAYPYQPKKNQEYPIDRFKDALQRPLGAYFRVNHKDLISMHSAIAEVGVLYATSLVHDGWNKVSKDGEITKSPNILGGHAFAIVGFDQYGFWIQNSWGDSWGKKGFAHVGYDDWLENGTDVWVARLGAPISLIENISISTLHASISSQSKAYSYAELRPHIISLGNEGLLELGGDYGTSEDELEKIFSYHFPKIMQGHAKKRLVLFAHGGLVSEEDAVNRLAGYRTALLEESIYPISFIWHSDYWSTMKNVLRDSASKRRPEGFIDNTKDFMLDRFDDALELLARSLTGKLSWDEMKENAIASSFKGSGAWKAIKCIIKLKTQYPDLEIHLVGHSAGSIFHSGIIKLLTAAKVQIKTCTLWAPACTVDLFKSSYLPAIENQIIQKFAIFVLKDAIEQDDNCAKIYNKSLLYLVSNAFEKIWRIPGFRDGEPILGMEKFISADPTLNKLIKNKTIDLVMTPNDFPVGHPNSSTAKSHGDFDDDIPTVKATLMRILGLPSTSKSIVKPDIEAINMSFNKSKSSLRRTRMDIANQSEV
ncbi:MAG: C1 family peptidase, partial [Methylotenera sp.]